MMNTHVNINPARISIVSIPRDKYWIFTSSVLQLLYKESSSGNNSLEYSEGDLDEEDFDPLLESSSRIHKRNSVSSANSSKRSSTASTHFDSTNPLENSFKQSSTSSNPDSIKPPDNSSKIQDETWGTVRDRELSPEISTDSDVEENYFFHIAFTPTECTIMCSTSLSYMFEQPLQICRELGYSDVKLLDDTFLSLQVDGDGCFDNSRRILELTKPLSDNSIPLFFLLSHFNDIVLIPYHLKEKVFTILTNKNFEFPDSVEGDDETNFNVQLAQEVDFRMLEDKTFSLFQEARIKPAIHSDMKLLLTGARSGEVNSTIMKTAKILTSASTIPAYFAITRTSINEVSLILPKSSKKRRLMGFDVKNIIGSTQDVIIPISIDFHKLPLDCTGLVAGVASKLLNGIKQLSSEENLFEMNYFSMARSGIIMIPQENVEIVGKVLDDINYTFDNELTISP
jgi:hypothetical protein